MTGKSRSTRRAFFLSGGTAIGTGVAAAVGASALKPESPTSPDDPLNELRRQLESAEDREAIRRLHLAFIARLESEAYEGAAELFDKREILQRFMDQYRHQDTAPFHGAYRQNATRQQGDAVTLSEDRLHAAATFHVDVELCTPLQGDCTVVQMARLQGHVADRRWEAGRFESRYVKTGAGWKVASLHWLADS